ncbi:MAG: hypothetical protein H7Y38_09705 [Armatimonadetes bacterium]|nr:hypothetical protein [Armatimonadota bacterium]
MMLATLHRLANRLPRWAWNALALFFAGAFVYAASVAWGDTAGDIPVRLVVVMYGALFFHAVEYGVGWRNVGDATVSFVKRFKLFEPVVGFGILATWFAILYPFFADARQKADGGQNDSHLKSAGLALLQYATDYDDTLPPTMRTSTMPQYLTPYLHHLGVAPVFVDSQSKMPFTWRTVLGSLYVDNVLEGSSVVVAYSPAPVNRATSPRRLTLFLDGHIKRIPEADFWKLFAAKPKHAPQAKGTNR